jgi:hypothetical protein
MKTIILIVVLFTTPVLFAQDINLRANFDIAVTLVDDFANELPDRQINTFKKRVFIKRKGEKNKESIDKRGVDISFYPNPTQRFLTIESSEPIDLIRMYNASGKEVMCTQLKNNKLSVADLDVGFYLVSVQSNGHIIKKKIIKKVN